MVGTTKHYLRFLQIPWKPKKTWGNNFGFATNHKLIFVLNFQRNIPHDETQFGLFFVIGNVV